MAYTVFARKYRPQTFSDLAGQEHVAKTLTGAIEVDRVAHAFLFTGVRGVGKTSAARVLAKALNCETGPTATPCNQCDVCRDITGGVDMDVLEIDGASNNGVEDVRRLQETLPFRPARDRFKVVIVDEVHMLTTAAFNAFLKTLEEPPPHVKFIFATTESHKVPITIRSRCQRYDFRLIPRAIIAERVRAILAAEEVKADDATVALVAREAAGSMRDALTLLDQIVAFGGAELNGETVARHLGIAARAAVQDVVKAILDGDGATVLEKLDHTLAQGTDPLHFTNQLLQLMRDLVVLAVSGDETALVDMVEEERAAAKELAASREVLELQRVFSVLAKVVDEVGQASSPRLVLEMGLVRAATRPALRPVGELLARLGRLEAQLGGTPPRRGPRGRSSRSASRPGKERAGDEPGPRPEPESEAPRPVPPGRAASGAPAPKPRSPEPRPAPSASGPARSKRDERPSPKAASAVTSAKPAPVSEPPARAPEPPARTSEPPAGEPRRVALQEWEHIVGALRGPKPALAAVLGHAEPRAVSGEKIIIAFKKGSFYGRQAASRDAKACVADVAEKRFGQRPEIEVRFDAETQTQRTVAAVEATRRDTQASARKREALAHPAVRDAMDVFPEARGKVDVQLED